MTNDQVVLICRLIGLGRYERLSRSEFLQAMGADDGVVLGLSLLSEATTHRDKDAVQWSMVVCYVFGYEASHLPLLHELAAASWHENHENVASAMDDVGSDESIPFLKHLAEWVPEYLEWDDNRALSTKAVWGIAKMGSPAAHAALFELAQSDDPHVVQAANFQIERLGLNA
ncbi:MAG: hypothetical protein RLZZ608_1283 [Actinomycetota bacterium]